MTVQDKTTTKPLATNPLIQQEEEIINFWEQADIFSKSLKKEAPLGNFVFFEGPPTANGLPGIHHVLARAFKDVLPRFKTMSGFHVERKAGWDTHGLPVELQVEKELGISGKPEIEKYGIKEFNQKCQASVWKYKDEWEKLTRRIGFWVDLKNPYVTYENYYIETLWWILKEIDHRGLLYKGHKVVPHCPRCGTALSTHEVAQGYKLVKDNSVYLKFKITVGNKMADAGDYILAWTTTPWTLPGNVALAVGPKINYVKVKAGEEVLILAQERLEAVLKDRPYKIIKEFKGKDLLDLEYQPLFEIKSLASSEQKAYRVVLADFVTTTDGTGVVHTAVMYGVDDYELGEKVGLPKIHTVDEAGHFTNDLAPYQLDKKFVKSATTEKIIIDYLKTSGALLQEEIYEHDYPFCWRCDTPLLYYAKNSWFIEMSKLKEQLIANNEKINWVPDHLKEGRFGEWLQGVKDWAISRERYWGTPLPIWECEQCGQKRVVGSFEELGELSGQKITLKSDLHRPEVDEYVMTCATCGGKAKRVKEVFDCWFDSGSMPFAQYHYPFENKNLIDKGEQFPADYICEAIDQTRGWFYTLLAVSTLLGKESPYRNVICLGHINDKFGKKMSKSKGNVINPWDVISTYGVDAVRQHMYTINQPGEGKRYDLDDVKEVFRKNIMLLSNVYRFYETYAPEIKNVLPEGGVNNILDKWIIAKLNILLKKVTEELNQYHIYEAAREIPLFIDELSTWYLRRSRDRFKSDDVKDKQSALLTTRYILLELSKVMAPFMPFMAENLWQKVSGYNFQDVDQSVHLEKWPKFLVLNDEEQKVLTNMDLVRTIAELGLAKRDEAGIKIRQMLGRIIVKTKTEVDLEYLSLITDELNIKEIEFVEAPDEKISVELDTEITPELKQEGIKRELIRSVNMLRKEINLTLNDETIIYLVGIDEEIKKAINKLKAGILKETLSSEIKLVDSLPELLGQKEVKINDLKLVLGLRK